MTLKTAFLSLTSVLVENGHQQFLWAHTELPVPYKAVSYFGECKQEKAADSHIYDRLDISKERQQRASNCQPSAA